MVKLTRMAAGAVAAASIAAAAVAQAPPTAPAGTAPVPDTVKAEIAEAGQNNSKIKTKPSWKSGPDRAFPDSEKALGHHGAVVVQGVLGVDGRLKHARIRKSSGAPVLDQIALQNATDQLFEPARDAQGVALPIILSFPVEFYTHKSDRPGGGLVHYECRQFVLEMDWWRATFPDAKWADHELYVMLLGLGTLARLGGSDIPRAQDLKTSVADFERRWTKSIEDCRRTPQRRFAQVLRPEGDMIDAMARKQGWRG